MSLRSEFDQAWRAEVAELGPDLLPTCLARASARVLPADGAGLTLLSGLELRVPLGASDDTSALAERLQFSTGEGPCFEAHSSGRPVTVTEKTLLERWPQLHDLHVQHTPFRGGLSLPLRFGPARIGALDFYLRDPADLDAHDVVAGQLIAELSAEILLVTLTRTAPEGLTLDEAGGPVTPAWLDTPALLARRQVWIAVGMLNLARHLGSADALALLRAHAYGAGRTVDDLAADLVEGRLALDDLPS